MTLRAVMLIARKEVRDALRNRWFLLYAAAFAGLAHALSRLALDGASLAGFAGFGRTAASLVNLVLLIVPLMGLTLGAASIAGERERGTLSTLLAQPIARVDVLLGKLVGLGLALGAAIALGFGLAALTAASGGLAIEPKIFAVLVGYSVLLALVTLAVGLLISAASRRTGGATGVALAVWLILVFLGDLGLMSTAITLRLRPSTLLTLTLANPLDAYKIATVSALTGSMDVFGPAGAYAALRLGDSLPQVTAGMLVLWIIVPVALAALVLRRVALT